MHENANVDLVSYLNKITDDGAARAVVAGLHDNNLYSLLHFFRMTAS